VIKNFLAGEWGYRINLDNDQTLMKISIDLIFFQDKNIIALATPAVKFGQAGW
jgi:hypothetical protein